MKRQSRVPKKHGNYKLVTVQFIIEAKTDKDAEDTVEDIFSKAWEDESLLDDDIIKTDDSIGYWPSPHEDNDE